MIYSCTSYILHMILHVFVSAFTVDDLVVPDEFEELVTETLAKVQALSSRIDANAYKDLTVFVDPIDVSHSLYSSCYRFAQIFTHNTLHSREHVNSLLAKETKLPSLLDTMIPPVTHKLVSSTAL